jgi:hypothetical protein
VDRRDGTVLASEENSDGLVLDGFIFDGATYNAYFPSGALDPGKSPLSPLLDLRGGRAPITVRNCLLLNGSGAAVNIASPFGVFENNVIVNTSGWALKIRADGAGPWNVRNNTIMFASDPTARAGTGQSSSDGTLFHLNGRATTQVDSNIFAFADNYGVRTTIPQQSMAFDDDVFAGNLHIHLTDTQYLWADSSTWERRAEGDSGFASFNGNTLALPRLPIGSRYADEALARLFTLPSRITREQWKELAAKVGSPATPPGDSDAPTPEAPKPAVEAPSPEASHTAGSLSDLLASLKSMRSEIKVIQSKKPAAQIDPVYCPIFDWKEALELAQDQSVGGPGAHRVSLAVSFAATHAKAEVANTRVEGENIDAGPAALDSKTIELDLTDTRISSADPSLFPAGTSGDDFVAYNARTTGETTRTRIAMIVRQDTATSRRLDRTVPGDKLRVRGTARTPGDPSVLAIVVDSAEPIQN